MLLVLLNLYTALVPLLSFVWRHTDTHPVSILSLLSSSCKLRQVHSFLLFYASRDDVLIRGLVEEREIQYDVQEGVELLQQSLEWSQEQGGFQHNWYVGYWYFPVLTTQQRYLLQSGHFPPHSCKRYQ